MEGKNGHLTQKKKAFQIFYQDASVLAKLAHQIHLEKPDPLISAAK